MELKRLSIPKTTPESELKPNALLIYGFLIYQKRFNKKPTATSIAFGTGITDKTVRSWLTELERIGLIADREPQHNVPHWFKWRSDKQDCNWWEQFSYWTYYVPAVGSPLKVGDAYIYGYLRSALQSDWQPDNGWSVSYLATCLRMDRARVEQGLETLAQLQLVEGFNPAPEPEGPQQFWFQQKGEKPLSHKPQLEAFKPDLSKIAHIRLNPVETGVYDLEQMKAIQEQVAKIH